MGDPPRRLGAAVLGDHLGDGSWASAYRASIGGVGGAAVCVKIAHEAVTRATGFGAAFRSANKVALELDHPNLVRTLEAAEERGLAFVTLEWIDGITLRDLLATLSVKSEALAIPQALTIALALARALASIESAGATHSDVSPQNVLLGRSGAIKLADFALARAVATSAHEATGKETGKPGYLSPERVLGQPVDGRSDQFSLGIVLWEMLAGARLFVGENHVEVFDRLVRGDIPPIHELRADADPELSATLDAMLAVDPSRRFPSMAVALAQLFRAHHRAVAEASDVDVTGLIPGSQPADVTLPLAPSLSALKQRAEYEAEWHSFSTSEPFAIVKAPGPSPDDTQPSRAAFGGVEGTDPARARPRTVSISGPVAERVRRWPRAPAGAPLAPPPARARRPWALAGFASALAVASVAGYQAARLVAAPPASAPPDAASATPIGGDAARAAATSDEQPPRDVPAPTDEAAPPQPVGAEPAAGGVDVVAKDGAGPADPARTKAPPPRAPSLLDDAPPPEPEAAPRQPSAEDARRVALLVKMAQQTFLRGDRVVANRILREAEKLDPEHPDVVRLRRMVRAPSDASGH